MKAVTVCVDFSHVLKYTLPYNRHHFTEHLIITTPTDSDTITIAQRHDCLVHATNSFYDNGALFNKWVALEEGLDIIGRTDWMCMLDADILWPRRINYSFTHGNLYTPQRRMAPRPVPEPEWADYPLHTLNQFSGYSHIFHSSDPHLPTPPWYQTNWIHAGGADTFFQRMWPETNKIRPNFQVLHVGCPGNWAGSNPNSQCILKELISKRKYPNPDYTNEQFH